MTPRFEPEVGQILHYRSYGTPGGEYGPECRAAIVTAVHPSHPGEVSLAVLNPEGMFFNQGVIQDVGKAGGTWHWPALG